MKADKTNEKVYDSTQAEMPLEDDVMASVSGGYTIGTGSLEESINAGELMNNLWSKLESHKDYGKAVKQVVNSYVSYKHLQSLKGFRWYAVSSLHVKATDNTVWVNDAVVNKVNA